MEFPNKASICAKVNCEVLINRSYIFLQSIAEIVTVQGDSEHLSSNWY